MEAPCADDINFILLQFSYPEIFDLLQNKTRKEIVETGTHRCPKFTRARSNLRIFSGSSSYVGSRPRNVAKSRRHRAICFVIETCFSIWKAA